MKQKKFYINTMGCQMNVYDSGQIAALLYGMGFEKADAYTSADLILANTCAIREKAAQKAFSFLGRVVRLKEKNPDLIVGIGGCVAQQEGRKILDRMPQVDLIFGTDAIGRLPGMIEKIMKKRSRIVDVGLSPEVSENNAARHIPQTAEVCRFVTIMQGCDNFCTYCVVPYVRGREKSRHPDHILEEIYSLAARGVREVTLLGQNVNSYGKKEGLCTFPELLHKIDDIKGLCRIRFTTSHPKDLSCDLMDAFSSVKKLCRHIHLPVQSGADTVLKRMNRGYTVSQYLEKVQQLKDKGQDIALSTDIIVGFPGETDADFMRTLNLIKTVEYDSLFAFNYSDRPNAPASHFKEKIPFSVQTERLQAVLSLQEKITARKHELMVGRTVEVLVEGKSKQGHQQNTTATQWTGRTSANKIVNFEPDPSFFKGLNLQGETVRVEITRALAHSLYGQAVAPSKPQG